MAVIKVLLCLGLSLQLARSHVRLLFPPARYPDLDFLDNVRTRGPCGVAKKRAGPGTHTTLIAGDILNITWFMAYPHKGGYKLQLLDSEERLKVVLSPSDDFFGSFDQTKEGDTVRLPSQPCQNCVIRLVRQAEEWGGTYNFWSCADVNIVKERRPEEMCSRKGNFVRRSGKCFCEPLRAGDFCQFADECHADAHCGLDKACKWLGERTYPHWGCFHTNNYFQNPQAPIPLHLFDPSNFKMRDLGNSNKVYWQIIQGRRQIKFVLQFKTRAWIAIGWKPQNLNRLQCTNRALGILWKNQDNVFKSLPEPEPHGEPEGEPEPPYSEPESEPPYSEPEPEPSSGGLPPSGPQPVATKPCEGFWKWPTGCTGTLCDYRIHWAFGGEQEEIAFFMEARIPQNNWWTGIGFSRSGRMNDADMLITKVQRGIVSFFDMKSVGYGRPILDPQQDVFTRITPSVAFADGRLKGLHTN